MIVNPLISDILLRLTNSSRAISLGELRHIILLDSRTGWYPLQDAITQVLNTRRELQIAKLKLYQVKWKYQAASQ